MFYGIYSIKYYHFIIINENNSLMSQLRQAPATEDFYRVYQRPEAHRTGCNRDWKGAVHDLLDVPKNRSVLYEVY